MGYWKSLNQCVNFDVPAEIRRLSSAEIEKYNLAAHMCWCGSIACAVAPSKDISWWEWIIWPYYALFKLWMNRKLEEERRRTQEEQKAADAEKLRQQQELIKKQVQSMLEANGHYQLIVVKTAVGMMAMQTAGNLTGENKKEFIVYIAGVTASFLPDKVKATIKGYQDNPPSFEQVVVEVNKLPPTVSRESFIQDIKMAGSDADGNYPESIEQLVERWKREVIK
jgi:hypothetical protein